MKKYYLLDGVINSKPYSKKKKFATREKAFNYMCKQIYGFTCLENEYMKAKHIIEYKFNNSTRFIISRVLV